MKFKTLGAPGNPAVLFFHAMGVTGDSSLPVAKVLAEKYYCILPTSSVYCKGQKYVGKGDEVRQIKRFLEKEGTDHLALVVASSIGADLAMEFLTKSKIKVEHVFFDGGQFAQIGQATRRVMVPFLYLAIKSLYWSKGKTLMLSGEMQRHTFFEFGSVEEHLKYRDAVKEAYPKANFPIFEGMNHMQYQIRDPKGFASMLEMVVEENRLPELPFLK